MYNKIATKENREAVKDGLDYVFKKGDYEFLTENEAKELRTTRLNEWKKYFRERYGNLLDN